MTFFAEKHYPEQLSPAALDLYLERGWYRMGQSIFTTHFLCFDQQLFSAMWVRLDLHKHQVSKSQRKLLRRNAARFRVEYAPLTLTAEKENLYQRYSEDFPGQLAPTLADSLFEGVEGNIYNTMEVQVYDEEQLVAVSYFDIGKNTAASIIGIYDRNYERHSLGYYTMLMEMAYCDAHDIRLYYPGYVVPGFKRFDYKLRIGEVDYYCLYEKTWLPYEGFTAADTPLALMDQQLAALAVQLAKHQVKHKRYGYPLFEANLFGQMEGVYLEFPLFISLGSFDEEYDYHYWVIFDVRDRYFKLLELTNNNEYHLYLQESYRSKFDPDEFLLRLMAVERMLTFTPDAKGMAEIIAKHQEQLD